MVNSRNKQFISFKLCAILSSTHEISGCPTWTSQGWESFLRPAYPCCINATHLLVTYRRYVCTRKKHSIYMVWYYLRFQASTGSLGTYLLKIRKDYCTTKWGLIILEGRDYDWDGHYLGASRVANKVLFLILDWDYRGTHFIIIY